MPTSQSIKQNYLINTLPNFRSAGVILRIFLFANIATLFQAFLRATAWNDVFAHLIEYAALLQPILLACLLLLYFFNPQLVQIPYRPGCWTVLVIVEFAILGSLFLGSNIYLSVPDHRGLVILHYLFLGLLTTYLMLVYFRWRALILSPAIYEARLQALRARIRPHFLFNCINSVLSIVRTEPKRAEAALEDMSDLFRMAMAGDRELVPLAEEIELSRQYLNLEQMRLGDRIKANWHFDHLPKDAMVPPLILQPLLENAVYHGIEPVSENSLVDIKIGLRGNDIHIEIYNPCHETDNNQSGNKLALANIRERLSLLFDIEAKYTVEQGRDFYRVHIVMPYVKGESA